MNDRPRPRIVITYCTQCHWLLRAAWMAQELLSTFADEIGEVALAPATGGAFRIEYEGELIWERKRDGGFPDAAALKRLVRDRRDPERNLGHVDAPGRCTAAPVGVDQGAPERSIDARRAVESD